VSNNNEEEDDTLIFNILNKFATTNDDKLLINSYNSPSNSTSIKHYNNKLNNNRRPAAAVGTPTENCSIDKLGNGFLTLSKPLISEQSLSTYATLQPISLATERENNQMLIETRPIININNKRKLIDNPFNDISKQSTIKNSLPSLSSARQLIEFQRQCLHSTNGEYLKIEIKNDFKL
jgi:hypothetical protein